MGLPSSKLLLDFLTFGGVCPGPLSVAHQRRPLPQRQTTSKLHNGANAIGGNVQTSLNSSIPTSISHHLKTAMRPGVCILTCTERISRSKRIHMSHQGQNGQGWGRGGVKNAFFCNKYNLVFPLRQAYIFCIHFFVFQYIFILCV